LYISLGLKKEKQMPQWNPWHGCHKVSLGCQNCYVYRIDASFERDSSIVTKTANFSLPLRKKRNGSYSLTSDETVYTCFSSDFFLEEADDWRVEAWQMIRLRNDLRFFIITKRIDRFLVNLPHDWGDGYDNVTICSTCENQNMADYRLPILLSLPIKHKLIVCEPLLESINLSAYLSDSIKEVVVGGESGSNARVCNYEWVLSIRNQCYEKKVSFHFKQTGANFVKDGRLYSIKRQDQHSQAEKAGIDLTF
jgi:protein gp37